MKAFILVSHIHPDVSRVYNDIENAKKRIDGFCDRVITKDEITAEPEKFRDTEYIFSTWGMATFTEEEIKKYFPSLKCVFYAAGTVQYFARPFLNCGVKVFSAWAANAVPVAEVTFAQILLSNKGFFTLSRNYSRGDMDSRGHNNDYPGNYNEKVGLIGAGMIGSLVAEKLKTTDLDVLVFDPFLSDEKAKKLNVTKCTLEEIFSECQTVSNHLANNEQTQGMLDYSLFRLMRPNSVFLNTGRGAQVVEDDLVRILKERPDITAVLDVTYPEPPEQDHQFFALENCILTPHFAGSSGKEVARMAEYMFKEYENYINNRPTEYEVTLKMLETMA